MRNLLMKEFKLGGNIFFYILPFVMGALMLIPGWLYFLVILYFCFISLPNLFGIYKSQNDLLFTSMLPVAKKDMVKARMSFIVILELVHVVVAAIFGLITVRLYPDLTYLFFAPTLGFWGLCLIMLAIFNVIFFPMYYKTAYKFGAATIVATAAAIVFAAGAEWLGIQNSFVFELFKGAGAQNWGIQLTILLIGIGIFAICNFIAYTISYKRFEKVEL